jgi:DNA-binding NtrC family response regulator
VIELGGSNEPDRLMEHPSNSLEARHRHGVQMASAVDGAAAPALPMVSASALVVERTVADALSIASVLTASRFHVTVAETFMKAKTRLSAQPPSVLLTEIRLAEYNGLHLVLRGKSIRPDMAALVLSTVADSVLQADAEAMGATFVLKPVAPADLTAAVFRTIFHATRLSPSARPVRPPFERRTYDRRRSPAAIDGDRRMADRRRDLSSLLRLVASAG